MKIARFLWSGGKRAALTSCWDDGTAHDRRLVALFNQYGLKGSFNLCSGKLGLDAEESGWRAFVRPEEVASLYHGHEVCSHTVDHPRLWSLPADQARWQLLEDRCRLERLMGYPVRGFVIPYNWPTGQDRCQELAHGCGFKYMRNSAPVPRFEHPSNFLDWHPTAHCNADLSALWKSMLEGREDQPGQLFYYWGHSYEFEDELGWDSIESFCRLAGETEGIYHATKGEIFDYITAWRAMDWSLEGNIVRNNSAIPLWFLRDGQTLRIEGGQSLRLK